MKDFWTNILKGTKENTKPKENTGATSIGREKQ